jgi:hypothetical protein
MFETKVLICGRFDLSEQGFKKKFEDIRLGDIKYTPESVKQIQNTSIVIFIDDNGDSKLLQNRYGNLGGKNEYSDLNEIIKTFFGR